jgi:hypothetical protein
LSLFRFVNEVKEKVDSKDRKHVSEEVFLIKTIKFFDAFDVGTVSYEHFLQGLEKLGFHYPSAVSQP